MARKRVVPPGLKTEYPQRLADQLARKYGALNQHALDLIDQYLIPAIAADDDVAIALAIKTIETELEQAWPDSRIEGIARSTAKVQNNSQQKRWKKALGVALGVAIIGNENPLRGSLPTEPKPKPGKQQTYAINISVTPELYADEFVAQNVKYIGELRKGIVPGLEDAVVRARQFGVPGVRGEGPEELARRLRGIWAKNGVPAQLPTTRLKANGQPVMLSTSKHALMVAEDQLAKLHSNIQQSLQDASGIVSYTWETRQDSKVREAHRVLQGQILTWQSGGAPGQGHPGQSPRCRCISAPVLDRDQILRRLVPLR